ncbi:MAG: hypothetical protein PHE83_17630 [Opitutaceae bacterium]|nr:hypothetical protein [Opitutaceae bacterium]
MSRPHQRRYRSHRPAAAFARRLGLRTMREWFAYCDGTRPDLPSRPKDIPRGADRIYRGRGWRNWYRFLGTEPRVYWNFSRARRYVRGLGLRSVNDWWDYCAGRRPDLPLRPMAVPVAANRTYRRWWRGWKDFLGCGSPHFRAFDSARKFARQLGLSSRSAWLDYCAGRRGDLPVKPADIPDRPQNAYRGRGWRDWSDWLWAPRSFAKARAFAIRLRLRTRKDWAAWCGGEFPELTPRPRWMPRHPQVAYQRQWRGWAYWLAPPARYRPYLEAAVWVQRLGLQSYRDWRRYVAGQRTDLPPLPSDIPRTPPGAYAGCGWRTYAHFLAGKENGRKVGGYAPYRDAAAWVYRLGLTTSREWRAYIAGDLPHLPPLPRGVIPKSPHCIYRGRGWTSWPAWLAQAKPFRPAPASGPE